MQKTFLFLVFITMLFNAKSQKVKAITKDTAFITAMLNGQNKYRNELGITDLKWNATLAEEAREWGVYLAAKNKFEHSRGLKNQGENLWMGTASAYSLEDMTSSWGNEKQFFKPAAFPDCSTNGSWHTVGHYTQIIWRNTTEVGCALVSNNKADYLVCRYNPAGNIMGRRVY